MIAVIADTHMPRGARRLPERCVELIAAAEAVIHAGDFFARSTLEEVQGRFPSADAVVFGHSHLPLHETERGFQIFNPGSPTERRRAPRPSMGLLSCEGTGLVFEHVWL